MGIIIAESMVTCQAIDYFFKVSNKIDLQRTEIVSKIGGYPVNSLRKWKRKGGVEI